MISLLNRKILVFFVALFSQFLNQITGTVNSLIMVLTAHADLLRLVQPHNRNGVSELSVRNIA